MTKSFEQSIKIKLNLGSGTNLFEGWINIDNSWNICLSKFPAIKKLCYKLRLISEDAYRADWHGKKVKRSDISKRLPFGFELVDAIYCSHALEHLTYLQAKRLCSEAFRVLKKGGIFRIVVPDLKTVCKKYVEGDSKFFDNSNRPIADLFLESLCIEGLSDRPFLERQLYSNHKYLYDEESLAALLATAGFTKIYVCNFKVGVCPDLEKIEVRQSSLYVEAKK